MSHRARILIVDDEPEMCQMLDLELSQEGYEVECAYDGSSAFIRLSLDPFDLVLTDLMMPGVSGTDLLRMIRMAKRDLPVIILTGQESADSALKAADLQVNAYLRKTTTSRLDLVDAIERALDNPVSI